LAILSIRRFAARVFSARLLYPACAVVHRHRTAWKLFLDPGIGLEKPSRLGLDQFKFDWVVNPRM